MYSNQTINSVIPGTGFGLKTRSVIVPTQKQFKAGILKDHLKDWIDIAADPVSLKAVQGVRIPLSATPPVRHVSMEELRLRVDDPVVDSTISDMLKLGAIQEIPKEEKIFLSRVFTVPKVERGIEYGRRFILNLKVSIRILLLFYESIADLLATLLDKT